MELASFLDLLIIRWPFLQPHWVRTTRIQDYCLINPMSWCHHYSSGKKGLNNTSYAQIPQQQPLDKTWGLFKDKPTSPAPDVPAGKLLLSMPAHWQTTTCAQSFACRHSVVPPSLHRHNQPGPSLANHRATELLRLESIFWDPVNQPPAQRMVN